MAIGVELVVVLVVVLVSRPSTLKVERGLNFEPLRSAGGMVDADESG